MQAEPQLQNGTAVIPSDADEAAVKQALFEALVSNKDALGEKFDAQSLEWEYYCEGTRNYIDKKRTGVPFLVVLLKVVGLVTISISPWLPMRMAAIRSVWPAPLLRSP